MAAPEKKHKKVIVSTQKFHSGNTKLTMTNNNEESTTQQSRSTVSAPTVAAKSSGRKKGVKNWKDREMDIMLDSVETVLPCGMKQWELVALHLFEYGFHREWTACKKKFESLWTTSKPTGSASPPRIVVRAQTIKEKIEVHENIGFVIGNDTDDEEDDMFVSPIKGTRLLDKKNSESPLRRPTPKKRKTTEMMEGLAKLSDGQEKAAETLASALKDIATCMSTKRSQDEFGKVNDLNKRMKAMENKINPISDKLDLILNKLSDNSL
jgi:hypothetical protein